MNLWITTPFRLLPDKALATMGPARYGPERPARTLKQPAQSMWVLSNAVLGAAQPPPSDPVQRPVDRRSLTVHSILVEPDPLFNRRESRRGSESPYAGTLRVSRGALRKGMSTDVESSVERLGNRASGAHRRSPAQDSARWLRLCAGVWHWWQRCVTVENRVDCPPGSGK